jgi:transcriptional regulator
MLAFLPIPLNRNSDFGTLTRASLRIAFLGHRQFATEEFPVAFPKEVWHLPVGNPNGEVATVGMKQKTDVLQGTLALMVLKTLDVLGPLHGYGIARRIEQISGDLLAVNQGTLYPVLLKLEQEGAIASEWGASENNRRARFYRLTREGRKQLQVETQDWEKTAAIIGRFFEAKAEDLP